jgi:hypothetical protein
LPFLITVRLHRISSDAVSAALAVAYKGQNAAHDLAGGKSGSRLSLQNFKSEWSHWFHL